MQTKEVLQKFGYGKCVFQRLDQTPAVGGTGNDKNGSIRFARVASPLVHARCLDQKSSHNNETKGTLWCFVSSLARSSALITAEN